eukprot:scaffold240530_cov30-Tisochrysis_lutea.AAC.7
MNVIATTNTVVWYESTRPRRSGHCSGQSAHSLMAMPEVRQHVSNRLAVHARYRSLGRLYGRARQRMTR